MLIKRLTLKKLLSFNNTKVDLEQLNVLIGPNAVGKSNLIEAIRLLQAAPTSMAAAILRGGGIRQWLWLGDRVPSPIATIECDLRLTRGRQSGPVLYHVEFSEEANGFVIMKERLEKSHPESGTEAGRQTYFTRSFNGATVTAPNGYTADLTIPPTESVLSQFKNPALIQLPLQRSAISCHKSDFSGNSKPDLDHRPGTASPRQPQRTLSRRAVTIWPWFFMSWTFRGCTSVSGIICAGFASVSRM